MKTYQAVIMATLLLIAISSTVHYRNDIHPANESVRVYAAIAIAEYQTIDISPVFDRYYPGWRTSGSIPNRDVSMVGGRYVLDKAPLVTLLAVPIVWLQKVVGLDEGGVSGFAGLTWLLTVLFSAIPLVLFAMVAEKRLNFMTWSSRMYAGPLLVLATPLAIYGGLLFGHALAAALFGFGMLYAPGHLKQETDSAKPRFEAVLGGFFLGCSVLAEYTAAVALAVLVLCLAADGKRRFRLPWVIIGGLLPAVVLMIWNHINFGSAFAVSYSFKNDPEFAKLLSAGLFGFTTPNLKVLSLLMFGSERGLLFMAPWLTFGFAGVIHACTRKDLARFWRVFPAVAVVTYCLMVSSFSDWKAGQAAGPRHLLLILPLLGLGATLLLDGLRQGNWLLKACMAGLTVSSILTCLVFTAWTFPYFSPDITNPVFEIGLPVLINSGPAPTIWSNVFPAFVGFAIEGVAAFAVLLICFVNRKTIFRIADFRSIVFIAAAAAMITIHLVVGMSVQSTGPDAKRKILTEQATAFELTDHEDIAARIRKSQGF